MSRKHDEIYGSILDDLAEEKGGGTQARGPDRAQARFLRRSTTLAEHGAGERREKVLRLVDPARCRMWDRHNRDYARLTAENCADLIEGLKAQGEQEFPAIVRRLPEGDSHDWEVICGARRHFAVSWLRANTYPQFHYLIEERELTDEEAFRLSDIENRDREDISDYERAQDYVAAIDLYYGGQQKRMAERLEVSASWLSRYLQLARLPRDVVDAFPSPHDLREVHARELKPLLAQDDSRVRVLEAARTMARERAARGAGAAASPAQVMARLRQAGKPPRQKHAAQTVFRRSPGEHGITAQRKGRTWRMEFSNDLPDDSLRAAFEAFLMSRKR